MAKDNASQIPLGGIGAGAGGSRATSSRGGGKYAPPSGREHAPLGPKGKVGGVHSGGSTSKAPRPKPKATKPSPPFKNLG